MSRDPVESLSGELLGLGEYSPSACLELLRLYAQGRPEAHKRPLLDDGDSESIALALGVYRHGGRVGVSGPTRDMPAFTAVFK